MTDLARLRQFAEAATAGPWTLGRGQDGHSYGGEWWPQVWPAVGAPIADLNGRPGAMAKDIADAAYIAAFNPTTAAALLDEIESLRAALRALAYRHEWTPGFGPCICDEHEAARAALLEAEPLDPEGKR